MSRADPRRRLRLVPVLLSLLLFACAPASHWARQSGQGVSLRRDPLADELVARAERAGLAGQPAWLKLVHYRKDPLGTSYRSDADGPGFFVAPLGRFDPRAELEATIRAVLAPAPAGANDATLDAHPACRFPARVMYLASAVGLPLDALGVPRCPGFERYLGELRPEGATLVFTSYYLNNPASAFGHTFLRIRKAGSYAVGEKRELLDYGIDFSADVTTENPVGYALMGLTGMFHGTFKRLPYYYKVREYNDTESRDLWEYDLDLSPEQLFTLVAHSWEVGSTWFDYYYVGENCSYAVYSLIDAARPELDLMAQIVSPVIPAATVQALFEHPGLVTGVRYRPALRSQLDERVRALSRREQDLVEAVERDPGVALPIPEDRAVAVLDAALDLLDTRHGKELIHDRTHSDAAERKQRLLLRRAAIRRPSPALTVARPEDEAPQLGHGASRVALGGGATAAGQPFVSLDARLALHDLADPPRGYPETAQIEFLATRLRFGETPAGTFRVELDRFDVVKVLSLSSLERFSRNISFQVAAGGVGLPGSRGRLRAAGRFLLGGGLAKSLGHGALTLWAMGDGELLVGRSFSSDVPELPLRIGAGPSGGLRVRLVRSAVLVLSGFHYWYPLQDPGTRYGGEAVLRVALGRDLALGAEGRVHPFGVEGQGLLYAYF
jgi:Domain of unknown function (DUF4105)